MGFMSLLIKGGSKALSYGKRIAKVAPDALLGETSDVIGGAMRHTKGSLFTKGKAGFHALEKHVARQSKNGKFFTRVYKNLVNTPKAVAKGYSAAAKNGLWAGIKGGGKALLKKMPLIGAVLTVAYEAPNIIGAFKDGGFKAGMKEIGGAGVELGCIAAGAAIGSAICPGVGSAIGGIIGGFVGMFARGKSHSEKKAEEAAAQEPAQQVQYSEADIKTLKEYGFTDDEIQQLQAAGYTIEDINKAIEQELNAMEEATVPEQAPSQNSQQTQLQNDKQVQTEEPHLAYSQVQSNEPVQTYDPIQAYAQMQGYDPTQAYQYQNINTTQPLGFNNTYNQAYMNTNLGGKYANDIFYQKLFGSVSPTINPFDSYINNQYQFYA